MPCQTRFSGRSGFCIIHQKPKRRRIVGGIAAPRGTFFWGVRTYLFIYAYTYIIIHHCLGPWGSRVDFMATWRFTVLRHLVIVMMKLLQNYSWFCLALLKLWPVVLTCRCLKFETCVGSVWALVSPNKFVADCDGCTDWCPSQP